mgnify:CR=1 FL=1
MRKYLLVFLTLSLLLSEAILEFSPVIGFLTYGLLITGCLISLSRTESLDNQGKLVISFMILPIVRVAELFIGFAYPLRSIIAYYILFFLVVVYSLKFKVDFSNWKRGLYFLPLTITFGIIIGITGNWLFNFDKYPEILLILPIMAFSEEALFRGLIQNLIKKDHGTFASIFFTAFLYGIFSLSLGIKFAFFMFLANLLLCLIYSKTKNIWMTIPVNFIMNLLLFTFAIAI